MALPTPLKTVVALAAAFAMFPAMADDTMSPQDMARQLQASLQAIQALQHRVAELEQKLATGSAPAGTPAQAAAPSPAPVVAQAAAPSPAASDAGLGDRVDQVERHVAQLQATADSSAQKDTGVALHGFADVKFGTVNAAGKDMTFRDYDGAAVGTLDLYMAPQVSPQIKTLFEIALEYENESQELAVDVERAQIGYTFSDTATVWAGRFHTPYGYWNTAFHHGAQIQTAITRPQFIDFEDTGGILPAHSVGAWLSGGTRTDLGKVGYDFYVTNGDRISDGTLDFQPVRKRTPGVATGFRLNLTPSGTSLTLGLHGLVDRVTGENADDSATGGAALHMLGGYMVYDDDQWEVMSEYYHFNDRALSGGSGTHDSDAWYLQAGYNLNDRWTPYVRYEDATLSVLDPYFTLQSTGISYHRTLAGLRYNLTPAASLKLEATRGKQAGTPGTPSAIVAQYAVRF